MTPDELRSRQEARRVKMQTPGEPDCVYHGLDGCEEAEADLNAALEWIGKLVAAGTTMANVIDDRLSFARAAAITVEWSVLLSEMGKS